MLWTSRDLPFAKPTGLDGSEHLWNIWASMSDASEGPGWWQASDGKWYSPDLHPDDGSRPTQPQPSLQASVTAQPPRRSRVLIAAVSTVILLVAVGVGVGVYMATQASAIGLGNGTATITWAMVNPGYGSSSGSSSNPPQPFRGTIDSAAVSGISTFVIPSNYEVGRPLTFERWTGSFDGQHFNLTVTASASALAIPTGSGTATPSSEPKNNAAFLINGMWGGDEVHAVVTSPATISPRGPLPFHGTVGKWRVTGTVTGPNNSGNTAKATARFTVSQ